MCTEPLARDGGAHCGGKLVGRDESLRNHTRGQAWRGPPGAAS